MGIFDFLKSTPERHRSNEHEVVYRETFDSIIRDAMAQNQNEFRDYQILESYKQMWSRGLDFSKGFCFYVLAVALKSWTDNKKAKAFKQHGEWTHGLKLTAIFLKELMFTEAELLTIAETLKRFRDSEMYTFNIPGMLLIYKIQNHVRQHGLTPEIRNALELLVIKENEYISADEIKQNERIIFLLQGDPNLEVNAFDVWGKRVQEFLREIDETQRERWLKLFSLAKQSSGKSSPSQKWLKQADQLLKELGYQDFSLKLQEWLAVVKGRLQEIHKSKDDRWDFLRNDNHEIFKGLIWCAGLFNDPALNATLDDYALWAYKKKPGIGPISARTGTAAMFAFSLLPTKDGVSRLSKFRMKIKNNTILKSINKILRTVAKKNNVSLEEIEEFSVPDHGVQNGEFWMEMDDCLARYGVESGELSWERNGKSLKSTPADIKGKFGAEIKALKNQIKDIEALLPVIRGRLEQSYLGQRSWNFRGWTELYLDHPLSSIVARKLIWHFSLGDQKAQAMFIGDVFLNPEGEEINWINNDAVNVQLWHPIGFPTDQILAWRTFLTKREIVQPFKQAFREVYLLTDAELVTDTYSNRFAAHVLRQHQFAALCRQRSWSYHLMGNWDSHNTPVLNIPAWNMMAEFYVNADWDSGEQGVNAAGIFNYILTDQVRFGRDGQTISLHDVPALLFSEVMRDVDLFVGVTSIGNDPAWQDSGDVFQNRYWNEYSFNDLSESAKIRSQVLQSIIPQLKIARQCSFDKKFLRVTGSLRTYKIHMGSGNILMEPDDQYLCIVPEGRTKTAEKVFLPFEGDTLLSIILSKAFLLAADDKITDQTIVRQINRKV